MFTELDSSVVELMRSFGDTSVLSSEETSKLLEEVAKGDKKAKSKLVCHNTPFILKEAKRFKVPVLSLVDRFEAGVEGFIKALNNTAKIKELKIAESDNASAALVHYASFHVDNAIKEAIKSLEPLKLSDQQFRRIRTIRGIDAKLLEETDLTPAERIKAIAEETGLPVSKVHQAFDSSGYVVSFDQRQNDDDDRTLEECICYDDVYANNFSYGKSVESGLMMQNMASILKKCVKSLPDVHRDIITRRFGLDGETPMTFEALGYRYGHTKQWASNVGTKALRYIREKEKDLDAFLYS